MVEHSKNKAPQTKKMHRMLKRFVLQSECSNETEGIVRLVELDNKACNWENSGGKLTPFGHGRSAVLLEYFAWGEMTFEIEMIVDRSINWGELLQGLYVPEFRRRTLSSPKRLVWNPALPGMTETGP